MIMVPPDRIADPLLVVAPRAASRAARVDLGELGQGRRTPQPSSLVSGI
jgi:hypothetical protein